MAEQKDIFVDYDFNGNRIVGLPLIPTQDNEVASKYFVEQHTGVVNFSDILNKPTTLIGYGILDAYPLSNPNGYISSVPPQQWTSILGRPTNVSSFTNDAGYITSAGTVSFASLTGKPTTISGYGITDAYPLTGNPSAFLISVPAQSFASLTGKPTTLSAYGITDAVSSSITLTINGTALDLSANRSWSINTADTLASTQIGFGSGGNTVIGSSSLTWDDSGKILNISGVIGFNGNSSNVVYGALTGADYIGLYGTETKFASGSKFAVVEVSVVGANDIFFQAFQTNASGWGILEAYGGQGLILETGGSGGTPIVFRPNRTEQMRLHSSGNLSLGITSDLGHRLHVFSNTNSSSSMVFENASNGSSAYAGIQLQGDVQAAYIYMTSSGYNPVQVSPNTLAIQNTGGDITFFPTNVEKMRIAANGNFTLVSLKTGVAGPTTTGTLKYVVCDTNGLLSNVSIPALNVSTKTGAYNVLSTDDIILADATGGAFNVTLPTAVGVTKSLTIKRINSGANAVTINTTSSQTIDGGSTAILSIQYNSITIVSNNANWFII